MVNGTQQSGGLIQNLYYYIQERLTTDWVTDPGVAVLLTIITCGIYGIFILYKLFDRRDRHFMRMANVVNTSVAMVRERAAAAGKTDLIAQDLANLEMVQREMYEQSSERGAVLWLIIAIFAGCIGWLIGFYILQEDYARHDRLEAQYFTIMSSILAKLGLAESASSASPVIPERNSATFVILSIITCFIYGYYWEYVLLLDGNNNFQNQAMWEDFIYQALAA